MKILSIRSLAASMMWTVALALALVGCDGCEDPDQGEIVIVQPEIVSFAADPSTIVSEERALLSWEVVNATRVTIEDSEGIIVQVFQGEEALDGQVEVRPGETTSYTLIAVNEPPTGGVSLEVTESLTVTVEEPANPPTVELTVDPTTIVAGENAVLTWETTNTESLSMTANGEDVELPEDSVESGTLEVSPGETTTYIMTATGEEEQATSEVTLAVLQLPEVVSFTATPDAISEGESAVLAWETTGAEDFEIRIGEEVVMAPDRSPEADSIEVTPSETTTYTFVAINGAGEVEAEATVTVRPAPAVLTFTAEPTQIARGLTTTLSFSTENADAVAIFANDDAEPLDLGELDAAEDSVDVSPEETTTFRLVATGPGGDDEAEVTVVVVDPVIIDTFVAEPALINLGESTTLRWETSGAETVSLLGPDEVALDVTETDVDGSIEVTPLASGTYTLRAVGAGGMAEAEAVVTVDDSVRVSLTVEPETIDQGGSAMLSWQTIAVDRIELTAEPGPTPDITGLSPEGDTLEVSPEVTTTYTLTGFGQGGEQSATVTLQVNPAVEIVSFEASPELVVIGGASTLTWETANAAAVTLAFGDTLLEVEDSGSFEAEGIETDTVFTLTAEGVLGPIVEEVTVTAREPVLPTIESFFASPETVDRDDETVLTWEVEGAETTTLTFTPEGGEATPIDIADLPATGGSVTVTPGVTTTYTLESNNAEGTVSQDVTVTVPLAILEFIAQPEAPIFGEAVVLDWRVQSAETLRLEFGEESVEVEFGDDGRGSFNIEFFDTSQTFTLVASRGDEEVTATVELELPLPSIGSFEVSNDTPAFDEEVTLTWELDGAETVILTSTPVNNEPTPINIDDIPLTGGSVTVTPGVTTTYTLEVSNDTGTVSQDVTVTVPLAILALDAESPVDLGADSLGSFQVQGAVRAEIFIEGNEVAEPVAFDDNGEGEFTVPNIVDNTEVILRAFDENDLSVEETFPIDLNSPTIDTFDVEVLQDEVGQAAFISWTTSNAESLTLVAQAEGLPPFPINIDNRGVEEGSVFVPLPVTSTFILTATNNVDSVEAEAVGEVPLEILEFSANPNPAPFGGPATIFIGVNGAITATLQFGDNAPITLDLLDGFGFTTFEVDSVDEILDYTLTVVGPGNETIEDTLTLGILDPQITTFTANPEAVLSGTDYVLEYVVEGAETLTLSGVDSQGTGFDIDLSEFDVNEGQIPLQSIFSTTWTLTATNPAGEATAATSLTVTNEPRPATIVLFEATPQPVEPGGTATILWETEDAVTLTLQRLDGPDGEVINENTIEPLDIGEGSFIIEGVFEFFFFRLVAVGTDNQEVTATAIVELDVPPFGVILSEVYYDAPGGDNELEWIELYNDGPFPVNLNRIQVGHGGGSFANDSFELPDFVIQPGQCIVVGGPLSEDDNFNPELDVPFHINSNLQNSGSNGGRADGLALFETEIGEIQRDSLPFDAVTYGGFIDLDRDPADLFMTPFEEPYEFPDVNDVSSGQSIYRIFGGGILPPQELGIQLGRSDWAINQVPTPGRCFGLPPEDFSEGDSQVFNGRRRGPELGGNFITLATFNANAFNTQVFFGENQAECNLFNDRGEFPFEEGLSCFVPPGTGVVDLTLRQEDGDVVYADFYTYESIDFCNVQFPKDIDTGVGEQGTIFGQVFEEGITENLENAGALVAEWGFGPRGVDPGLVPDAWTWFPAQINFECEGCGNNFEYFSDVTFEQEGSFAHAYRVRFIEDTIFTYCDANGTVNNNPRGGNLFNVFDAGTLDVFLPQ